MEFRDDGRIHSAEGEAETVFDRPTLAWWIREWKSPDGPISDYLEVTVRAEMVKLSVFTAGPKLLTPAEARSLANALFHAATDVDGGQEEE